ncbi:MAG TPA: class I SAM-dependent methyltransferase [Kofleriaceae bacterium]
MRIREHWPIARSRQRRRDFAAVFGTVPPGALGDMLEIGSGDGFLASMLAPLGRSMVTTDLTPGRAAHAPELPRVRCSATSLPFADASFDFIFSSSVLEHVRERELAMAELGRCLRPDGVMIHLMPSTTWKFLQLALYYPHCALSGIEMIGANRQLPAAAQTSTEHWRDEGTKPSLWQEVKRGVFPQVHGEFKGHIREFIGFRAKSWVGEFERAGFAVRGVFKLPLCTGYGFGFERLRGLGERIGLSAHNAFIVARPGEQPSRDWHWPGEQAAS